MIAEPMTLLTDWLLAAQCAVLGRRLLECGVTRRQRSIVWLACCFASTAVGAFVGGASHGFRPYLGAVGYTVSWKLTVLAIGVTAMCFLISTAAAALAGVARRVLIGLAVTQAVVYGVWVLAHDDFDWVVANYVLAMLVVLALQLVQARRAQPSAAWIAAGIVTSFIGAAIQLAELAPSPWFNHNDVYHVVQMAAMWLLYRGGLLLRDRSAPEGVRSNKSTFE